jgi:hypothetical protein
MKELTQNLIQAGGQFLSQMATQMIPGPFGTLLGGGIQFAFNMLGADKALPIKNGAMEVRVVNFSDLYLDMTAIRDRSELAYSKERRDMGGLALAIQVGG